MEAKIKKHLFEYEFIDGTRVEAANPAEARSKLSDSQRNAIQKLIDAERERNRRVKDLKNPEGEIVEEEDTSEDREPREDGSKSEALRSTEISLEAAIAKVETTRAAYIQEYKNCRGEMQKQTLITRTKTNILKILGSKATKERIAREEEFLTKKLNELKKEYDTARVEMGNAMYAKKRQELKEAGKTEEEIGKELAIYKASEIFQKTIIDERQKVIDAKVESSPIKPTLWKQAWNWYRKQPRGVRVLISTTIFLPAAAFGAAAPIIAGYGLAGLATAKFVKSMLAGAVASHAVRGVDMAMESKDTAFKKNQEDARQELRNKFALGEIDLEEYEKQDAVLEAAEKKRMRNRMLVKAAVSVAIGAGVGFWANAELSQLVNINSVPGVPVSTEHAAPVPPPEHHHTIHHHRHHVHIEKPEKYDFDSSAGERYEYATGRAPVYRIEDNGDIKLVGGEADGSDTLVGHANHNIRLGDDGTIEHINGKGEVIPQEQSTLAPIHKPEAQHPSDPGEDTDSQSDNANAGLGEIRPASTENPEIAEFATPSDSTSLDIDHRLDGEIPVSRQEMVAYQDRMFLDHNDGPEGGIYHEMNTDAQHAYLNEAVTQQSKEFHSLGTEDDIIKKFGINNVITERSPGTIHGIRYEDWNNRFDYKVFHEDSSVMTYHEYETERTLQQMFGHAKGGPGYDEALHKNAYHVQMDYFRDNTPTWETTRSIPAKYFFGAADTTKISEENMTKLIDAGVCNEHHEFIPQKELLRLREAYAKVDRFRARPDDGENIEEYVYRLTSIVHQAKDGTLFIPKDGAPIHEVVQTRPQPVYIEQAQDDPSATSYSSYGGGNGFTNGPVRMTDRNVIHIRGFERGYDMPWRLGMSHKATEIIRGALGRHLGRRH